MDKDALLSRRAQTVHGMPEEDVALPGGLGTVRVRALTRKEGIRVQQQDDIGRRDVVMLSLAMVDPPMSEQDVESWQDIAPAGEIEAVSVVIARLSRLTPDASKEAYKSS